MYIFANTPVTTALSNVEIGPKITPINFAYLALWERKYLQSSKTWECIMKTKQANKVGPATIHPDGFSSEHQQRDSLGLLSHPT